MLSQSLASILRELEEALTRLPPDAEERAARFVTAHGRVFVAGMGRSGLMLRAFAMRLAQMGLTVYVAGETVTPAVGPGDGLMLASASGRTHTVCHYARTAAEAGADLFVVTAEPASPLTEVRPADVVLPCGSKDRPGASSQMMGSLFEQALLIFLDGVVSCLEAPHEAMRARHANLE